MTYTQNDVIVLFSFGNVSTEGTQKREGTETREEEMKPDFKC